MPRLSILVPLSGPVSLFENTLASVLQNRPADCDVLVVHPESYDDPWEVIDEVQLLETPVGVPLLEMLDASLPYVRGEFLHILQPGLEVTEGWADRALEAFRADDVVAVSPWIIEAAHPVRLAARGVAFDPRGGRTVVGAGVAMKQAGDAERPRSQASPAGTESGPPHAHSNLARSEQASSDLRSADARAIDGRQAAVGRATADSERVLGPTLRAGFYRTALLAEIGGWETSLGLAWADVDLALSFAAAGLRCVESAESIIVGPSEAVVAASPAQDAMTFAERFAAGRCGERVYLRHSSRIDGLAPMVARGAGLVASWLAGGAARPSLAQVAGRMAAWSERPRHREFRRELAEWTAARRPRPVAVAQAIETPSAPLAASLAASLEKLLDKPVDKPMDSIVDQAAGTAAKNTLDGDRGAATESVPRRAA